MVNPAEATAPEWVRKRAILATVEAMTPPRDKREDMLQVGRFRGTKIQAGTRTPRSGSGISWTWGQWPSVFRRGADPATARDVNELGPSPQARKPAGTFPSPPGPQPAFFSPHLIINQYCFQKITQICPNFFKKKDFRANLIVQNFVRKKIGYSLLRDVWVASLDRSDPPQNSKEKTL